MDAKYVLCSWKGRLWPAKILSRSGTKYEREMVHCLEVQILALDKKIKVKSTEIQILTKSQMETIVSSRVAESNIRAPSGEERAYRRALKVAMEILEERAHLGHSSTLQKEQTTTLSHRVPQKTSRAFLPKKYGKGTGEVHRSHVKKIEFSKFLVVSLERCDSLCGDTLQKHRAIGSIQSEVEPKSSPSSRVGHSYPSLSEGGDEEDKKKAGTAADRFLSPLIIKDGARAKQQEGIPIWPSSGIMCMGLDALREEARNICPKTPVRSHESSPSSENTENPREGHSEPSLACTAMCSSSSNLCLARRKRKLQIKGAESVPQKGLHVGDSKIARLIKSKKIELSKFLVVSLERCDSLCSDKLQKQKAIGSVRSEMESKSSPSSRPGHSYPSLSEGSDKEGKKKADTSAVRSLSPMVLQEGVCAEHKEGIPIRPSGTLHMGLEVCREEAWNTCPKSLAGSHESSSFSENMENPREGLSELSLAYKAMQSSSSNLCLAKRKRNLQIQGAESVPQKRLRVGDSKITRLIKSKKIEFSKFLVVSLERCDSLCSDKLQKQKAIGSVRSEMESKSSPSSRLGHSYPSLSEGSDKEGMKKAGTSAVRSLSPMVLQEGACVEHQEGIPIRPSGTLHMGLEALREEARNTCPKSLVGSHESSSFSENMKNPREGLSELSLAYTAAHSSSSNLCLAKRKRNLQIQGAESVPQKGLHVGDSKIARLIKSKKIELSKFLVVSLERCDSLCSDKLQKQKAIGSVRSEMESKSSPSSRLGHSYPSLSEGSDKEGKKKAGTSAVRSLSPMVLQEGACVEHQEGIPIRPSGTLHMGLEALREEARNTCPKGLVGSHESSSFSENMKNPREGLSELSLAYTAAHSSSSNLCLAKRKRNLQIQGAESVPQKGLHVGDSKIARLIKSKKIELSKFLVVSLERCDSLCSDKLQKQKAIGSVRSEMESKSSPSSRPGHSYPSLSEGSDKEGKKKADTSAVRSLSPMVLQEGVCAEHKEGIPIRPSGTLHMGLEVCREEAWNTCPKSLAGSHESSSFSENTENPREGLSELSLAYKAMQSSSSNLCLAKRKRNLQIQGAESVPQKRLRVGDSKITRLIKSKKIEFSKFLVVSLERCDSLCSDKLQKQKAIGSVRSEMESKSSPSSRLGHSYPSLSEGSDKEGMKKAGTSAVRSLSPMVLQEGACVEHQEGIPIRPSGTLHMGLEALREEARNTCPKSLVRSHESSSFSENMKNPREGLSELSLAYTAAHSSSSNLCLAKRKRNLQIQGAESVPQKGLHVGDSKIARLIKSKKIELSKFLVVSLERCDSLCSDKLQKQKAIGSVRSEMESKSSPSSRLGHSYPSLSEGSDKEGKKKAGTSAVRSLSPMVLQEGACAEHREGIPIRPSGTLCMGLEALREEARNTCPKSLVGSHESSSFSENMENPREGLSELSLAYTAAHSSSSNLCLAKRKRNLQIQGAESVPQKGLHVGDSKIARLIKSKKIELSKFLVVSLERCDSLCSDKLQKQKAIGSVRSEMESKSSPSSRLGHSYPSLSEGSDTEGKEKAGTSAVRSLSPMVLQEGACVEHQEGIPIRPSGTLCMGLEALREEARNTCPKSLARSHENSSFSENTENPREGPPELSLAYTATHSSSSNVCLAKRKRNLQIQGTESAPPKGLHVGDSKVTRLIKSKKFSKFLLVPLVRCDSLCSDKFQKYKAIDSVRSEMKQMSSPSSRVGHSYLSLSEGSEEEGKKKAGTSAVGSLSMFLQEGACAQHQEGILHTGLQALREEAQNTFPKSLVKSHESSSFSENTEGPIKGPSEPRLACTTKCSSFSNICLAKRKRKLQIQGSESAPSKGIHVGDSKATRPIKSRNRFGRRQGLPMHIACPQESKPIERGMVVWFKFQDYPYWPAVVVSIQKVKKTARVLLIEDFMSQEWRGIQVPLRRLKHLDCQQKPKFMKRARKLYGQSVDWCCSLVTHYREGIGRRSFVGSFLEYFEADISYPIRKAIQEGELESDFPRVNYDDLEESEEEETYPGAKKHYRRLLPDRMKAARDRENRKLLDFIVKRKGAERHLLDIVDGKKKSTWLDSFLSSTKRMVVVETYLEDDDQLDILVKYLQEIYKKMDNRMLTLIRNDKINFLVEVLLPEAIICSISAVEGLDYKDAEAKYLKGPPVHYREKELFDRKVIRERRRKLANRKADYVS